MDDFLARVMELALGQGLWAVLYVYLFFRMLNENKSREERVLPGKPGARGTLSGHD